MTGTLIDHSPAVVAAIRKAFGPSRPCHCEDDECCSEMEILASLANQRVIRAADMYTDGNLRRRAELKEEDPER